MATKTRRCFLNLNWVQSLSKSGLLAFQLYVILLSGHKKVPVPPSHPDNLQTPYLQSCVCAAADGAALKKRGRRMMLRN
jgi:hypothetical protein